MLCQITFKVESGIVFQNICLPKPKQAQPEAIWSSAKYPIPPLHHQHPMRLIKVLVPTLGRTLKAFDPFVHCPLFEIQKLCMKPVLRNTAYFQNNISLYVFAWKPL